jgi:hypothetical protein
MTQFINFLIIIIIGSIACTNQKLSKSDMDKKKFDFIKTDTIQSNKTIELRSFFCSDYGNLTFINSFENDSVIDKSSLFIKNLYSGFTVEYKDKIYDNIINFNCKDCENYFGVFNGDSIDNIDGFNPIFIENNTIRFLILAGYYHGCNGSFCNFGSILVLKFQEKELQQIYLFGIDKTMYSLYEINGKIINNNDFILNLHQIQDKIYVNLILNDKIELINNQKSLCELEGIVCIK